MGEGGLEKFDNEFTGNIDGGIESPKDHTKRMDKVGDDIGKLTEAKQKQAEAGRERLEEVDDEMVETFVTGAKYIPEDVQERMLKAIDTPENEATVAEIRRRLSEDNE